MPALPQHRLDPRMLRVWHVSDVIGIVVVAVLAVVAQAIVRHLGGDVFWVYLVAGVIELVCVGDLLISPHASRWPPGDTTSRPPTWTSTTASL